MAKLLLVEDDELMGRMLSLRLGVAGHVLDIADNGRSGVDKALAGDHDLVLMDMHMPEMDGHEAVRLLRSKGYRTTIVAVTASAMNADTQRAIEAGCDAVINKPIDENFAQRVAALLDAKA